jgi:hypothetical protein
MHQCNARLPAPACVQTHVANVPAGYEDVTPIGPRVSDRRADTVVMLSANTSGVIAFAIVTGCVIARPAIPTLEPGDKHALVMVVSGGLGGPADLLYRHTWIVAMWNRPANKHNYRYRHKHASDDDDQGPDDQGHYSYDSEPDEAPFRIWEVDHPPGGPVDRDYVYDPIVHGVWRGERADRAVKCLDRAFRDLPETDNNNRFVELLLRRCDLHASLPATALGKDLWVRAGITTEGTGVQLDTPLVGLRLGLKEGIEVHVLGMAFGIDLWPPALIVPFGPGRIGFADR